MPIRSWDCWDTLIARRSLVDVHDESDNIIPIAENVAQVRPADVLVSDYYDAELLRRKIPEITGLTNRIVVTLDGKRTGRIWRELACLGLGEHIGDDPHCDVESPRRHGIKGTLCQRALLTSVERQLNDAGFVGLARTMREARLVQHSSAMRSLQLVQTQVNFPLLFLASLLLHRMGRHRRMLMSSRDCCLWQHVLALVRDLHGGDYDVVYFHTSRLARAFPSDSYLTYVNKCLPGLIVDVAGTGWSLARLLQHTQYPSNPIALIVHYEAPDLRRQYHRLGVLRSEPHVSALVPGPIPPSDLESINVARHAMFLEPSTVFNPLDYPWESAPEIQTMHEAFFSALGAAAKYDFSADLNVATAEVQAQLRACVGRTADYLPALRPLWSILSKENDLVMQRLREMSQGHGA